MSFSNKFSWKMLLSGSAVAMLVVVLFVMSQGASPVKNRQILAATDRYARFAAELDVEIIRLRHRYLNDYDLLVDDLNRVDVQLHKLDRLLSTYQDPSIRKLLDEMAANSEERRNLIERFKGVNSVLRNSTFYLPKTVEILRSNKAASPETVRLSSRLLEEALVLGQEPSVDQQQTVRDLVGRLKSVATSQPALSDLVETTVRHTENILAYQAETDQLVDALTVKRRRFGDELRQAYLAVRSEEESKARLARILLSVLSLLLILYAVRSYLMLRERSVELQSALLDLQNQKFALDQHAIVSATDVRGNIVYANDKFCNISQYTREEMLGQNHRMLKSDEHDNEFFVDLWKTIAQGKVWHGQVKNRTKDGNFYWVDATVVPFLNEQGKPYQYISIRTDITALKLLQAKTQEDRQFLETVMETLGEGVFVLDSVNVCTYVNSEALNLLGYERSALTGARWPALPQQMGFEQPAHDMMQLLKSGDVYHSARDTMLCANGAQIPVEVVARPIMLEGQYHGVVCAFRDVSDRLRYEQELLESREHAERANRSKSQFLATMSHEIRTPLNGVIGMLDLVLDTALDAERKDMLSVARQSADHLLSILNEILDFSKIESGMLQLENEPFRLRDQLNAVLKPLEALAHQRNLNLTWHVSEDLPDTYMGDSLRLRQILFNLVSNAIKFTHRGGVSVNIAAEHLNDVTAVLAFSVKDTGIGIPEDKLAHIFEPFSQADASTTRNYGGTGLGLSICKRLTEMMGGGIEVSSRPNDGSEFRFKIVLQRHHVDVSRTTQWLGPDGHADAVGGYLLLVEDNLVNQRIAKHVLEKFGFRVELAENGQEALDLWRNGHFDLILMDMQMPVMDGLETTIAIRNEESNKGLPRIPIVAMTANAYEEDRQRCVDVGMDGFVSKPIDREALYAEVVRLMVK